MADAGGQIHRVIFEAERLIGFLGETLYDAEQIITVRDLGQDDAELVASESRQFVDGRASSGCADGQRRGCGWRGPSGNRGLRGGKAHSSHCELRETLMPQSVRS